jgi:hypothetical protein
MKSLEDLKGIDFGHNPVFDVVVDKEKKNGSNENKPTYYVQKFSDTNLLAEAILIGNLPYFLVVDETGSISTKEQIEVEDKILKPIDLISYVNKPYMFTSKEQLDWFIDKTKRATLDCIYKEVKTAWKKYVDADDFHITICAADTVFTYFQDKLGLTHYLFFVGNNGSGKSNNLKILHILAYRNMMSTDITPANIYQFLGITEEGVGTICEDEADDIDEDRDKMRIYKNGYTTGQPVMRTETSYGRKQFRFFTYGFKAFAAEKLPDLVKAKGFNQRIIEIPCVYGFPQHDIAEVMNPAGEEKYQELLKELLDLRNTLLIYRLLHYKNSIPDIRVNLQNREKQLFKPVLRLFNQAEVLKELLPVISKYVNQKREANSNTFYAFLHKTVKQLIESQDSSELSSTDIWQSIASPDLLPGDYIPGKKLSYDSVEFGVISQKEIVEILVQVFGAKQSRTKQKRSLIFDIQKLERVGKIYDLDINVEVSTGMTDVTHVTDLGLDKFVNNHGLNENVSTTLSPGENSEIRNRLYYEKIIVQNIIRNALSTANPSYPSYASSHKEV